MKKIINKSTLISLLLIGLFLISSNKVFCQIAGKYKYSDSEYFPTKLHLRADSTFLYREYFGKRHANNEYFEKGNYKVIGDTVILEVRYVGFNCDNLIVETKSKIAVYKNNFILILREDYSPYLKLKKRNFRGQQIGSYVYYA